MYYRIYFNLFGHDYYHDEFANDKYIALMRFANKLDPYQLSGIEKIYDIRVAILESKRNDFPMWIRG